MKKHIMDTASCLKVLTMNAIIALSMDKDKDKNVLRAGVRFWLANVLASKPGHVNPIVHESLFCCCGIHSYNNENIIFDLIIEENRDDVHCTAALFVSELRAMVKKDIKDVEDEASHFKGLSALIHLNIMMSLMPFSSRSLRSASLRLGVISVVTSAVLKLMQEGGDPSDRGSMIVFVTTVRSTFSFRGGVQWAVEALQAGILTIIATGQNFISQSNRPLDDDDAKCFEKTINSLTLYLTHYPVVRAAVNALASIELDKLEKMKEAPFFAAWKGFLSTVFERAVFMSRLSQKFVSAERKLHCDLFVICLHSFRGIPLLITYLHCLFSALGCSRFRV